MTSQRQTGRAFCLATAFVAVMAGLWGCGADTDQPKGADPTDVSYQQPLQSSLIDRGQEAYERYCAGCHGLEGDGLGKSARFLDPRPRDFTKGDFKFSWTRSGQLPTNEDLKRTIREGLKGSAMPPWRLLPDVTVDALVEYIKTFSPKWKTNPPAPKIPMVEDPYRAARDYETAIARGRAVYHGFANCWSCHPAYASEVELNETLVAFGSAPRVGFRPNLHLSAAKPNTQGELLFPPDFRRDFVRSGADLDDLYRVIGAGVTGAAMPTWIDSMNFPGENEGDPPLVRPSDVWAVAYYVQDLITQRPSRLTEEQVVVRDRPQTIYAPGVVPSPTLAEDADEPDEEEDAEDEFEDEFADEEFVE